MSETTKFDEIIAAHVSPIAEQHRWKETDRFESSRGAYRDYIADNVRIRVSNDRGLIGMEIGSFDGTDLRPVSFYMDMLTPPKAGRWNPTIHQQCEFLKQYREWLNDNLCQEKAPRTVQALDENTRAKR